MITFMTFLNLGGQLFFFFFFWTDHNFCRTRNIKLFLVFSVFFFFFRWYQQNFKTTELFAVHVSIDTQWLLPHVPFVVDTRVQVVKFDQNGRHQSQQRNTIHSAQLFASNCWTEGLLWNVSYWYASGLCIWNDRWVYHINTRPCST